MNRFVAQSSRLRVPTASRCRKELPRRDAGCEPAGEDACATTMRFMAREHFKKELETTDEPRGGTSRCNARTAQRAVLTNN